MSPAQAQGCERFRSLFDHTPGLALALDLQGRVLEANPGAEQVFGHAAHALCGRDVASLVPSWDDGDADSAARMQRLLQFARHELVARHASGERRQLSATLVPAVVGGQCCGYFLIGSDVTQQTRHSRQLQVQADVIDRTHDAVVVLDEAGCVLSWNQGATRLYGVDHTAMLGQRFDMLFGPADQGRLRDAMARCELGAATPADLELRPPRPGGDAPWVLLSLSRIPGPEGRRELLVVYGLDITARRIAEDALRHALARAAAQAQRQQKLGHAAVEIHRHVGSEVLLQRIADDLRLVVGAHQSHLHLVGDDGRLSNAAVSASAKHAGNRLKTRDDTPACTAVLQHRSPMLVTRHEAQERLQWRGLAGDCVPLNGWLAVPLLGRDGSPVGLIELSDKYDDGDFDGDDLDVMQQLAYVAAAAIESDTLLRRAAAAEQRLQAAPAVTPHPVTHDALARTLLNDSADALVVVSADQRVRYVNPAAQQLLGVLAEPDETLALSQPFIPGQTGELMFDAPDGETRLVELKVSATAWDGESANLLAVRDITERRAAEHGLVLGREVMEQSEQGIVIADASDERLPLIYVNPAFERITGYARAEALGRDCGFLQRRDREQPGLHVLHAALAEGEGAQVVLRNYRKDGSLFWNELTVTPVRNSDGAVAYFVGILNDVTERQRRETELVERSTHDALTGLPNRTLLLDRMRQALAVAHRGERVPGLLMVDLDHFREVNSSLGQRAGDELLLEVVARLKGCLRNGDTLSRQGGDEFVALLPDLARADDASLVAEKILRAVSEPYVVHGQPVYCSCSIGVSVADRADIDPTELIHQASLAVHAAKRGGRNTVQFYSGGLAQRVSDRLEMRARLQTAISAQEFELHYQPQVDLHRHRVSGVEALVRWRHPQLGLLGPLRFVPVAEETGQIVAIGEWVMEQACAQHRRWLDSGAVDCAVSVNVSSAQFHRERFVETVAAVLERTGLPPNRLELEFTESVMMDAAGRTLETLQRLRALGVSVSIDDFGTGFSSLGHLKRLPIDKVKIDRSFVTDITQDSDDAAITLSVIAIAHHLRLRVVAVGVSSPAQMAFLKRHLCDGAQGFFISPPLPANEFEAFLAAYRPPVERTDSARPTLLLVDDEPNILRSLTRTLRHDGYRILTAKSASEAFQVLAQNDVQVVLSDQRMPDMCGTDFLSEVKSLYPHTVRIVLSGYTDLQSVTEAINRGAIYRFLTKPWEDEALRAHIKEAFLHQQRERAVAPVK